MSKASFGFFKIHYRIRKKDPMLTVADSFWFIIIYLFDIVDRGIVILYINIDRLVSYLSKPLLSRNKKEDYENDKKILFLLFCSYCIGSASIVVCPEANRPASRDAYF